MQRKVLVTGGAGFIGSAVCRHLVGEGASVLNIDALTYAGNLQSLATIGNAPNYRFAKIDICDRRAVAEAFATFAPDHVIHLAAESHVDRSIMAGDAFIQTNIVGAFSILEAARGRPLTRVKRIATADYPTPARRPANSRLDNGKLSRVYGLTLPEWRASLTACCARLLP